MNNERVFITGANGFIGNELVLRCVKEGYEVGGLVREHSKPDEAINKMRGKVKLFVGDIRDKLTLDGVMRDFNPHFIVHFCALSRVGYSFNHVLETCHTNFVGTVNMVLSAQKYASNLQKFFYASSVEVYGQQDEYQKMMKPLTEDLKLIPLSPYGVWKTSSEYFLKQQHICNSFPAIMIRQTNTYGDKYDPYCFIEYCISQMIKNPDAVSFGNPEPYRAFIYIDDLVDMYLHLFKYNDGNIFGEVFNTGPPNAVTIGELARIIAKKMNWNGKINWYTRERRVGGEVYYLNAGNDKITNMTGWKPKISLDEGLDKTISFWKNKLKQ